MSELRERIYEERKKKGLSQGDLAAMIGVSGKAVSKWETGEAQPTLENIARLSDIFGVSADYLVSGKLSNGTAPKAPHNFTYLEDHKQTRHGLRVAGWIVLPIGLLLDILGLTSFFLAFYGEGRPDLFFLLWIGFPLTFVGGSLLMYGYIGSFSRYTVSQTAPVAKDATNYVLQGTREEAAETIKAASEAIHGAPAKGPVCPVCGTPNEVGAAFCDHCGKPLAKKCPHCGEANDPDAKFCRKCGAPLN